MPTNCYWAFSHWSDGVINYPNNPLSIVVGPTNCDTAIFRSVVTGCETNGSRPFGAPIIIVNGNTVTNQSVMVSNFANVEIQAGFPNGRLYYTYDCSALSTNSTNYTGPFTVIGMLTLRALAVSEDRLQFVESCPVTIRVEPHPVCLNDFFVLDATTFSGEGHGGTVKRSPAYTPYPCETVVTVLACPDIGWTFLGWLGDAEGPNPSVTFSMNRDICAQAVFAAPLSTAVGPHGSIVREPEAPLVPYGAEVRLTAVPDPGYYFWNWNGDVERTNSPLNITANNPFATAHANFAPLPADRHALTVMVKGRGQVQTRPQASQYITGTQVTNTALPNANQMFLRWEGDTNGAIFMEATRVILTMNSSKAVRAVFTSRPRVDIARCLGRLKPEGFELTVTGDLGARYLIQATPVLRSSPSEIVWADLGIVTNTLGIVEFIDPGNADFPQRLYRAVELP